MDILNIRSGSNQNDAPRYEIIKLYENEQASEQPNAQPNAQADEYANEHIITILYSYFNYINNSNAKKFANITSEDKAAIILILRKLELYTSNNNEILKYMSEEAMFDLQLQYWVIKELYLSPYKVYLNNLKRERFILRFLKSKKYVDPKENTYKFLNYFIKSMQQDFCKEKNESKEVEVQLSE